MKSNTFLSEQKSKYPQNVDNLLEEKMVDLTRKTIWRHKMTSLFTHDSRCSFSLFHSPLDVVVHVLLVLDSAIYFLDVFRTKLKLIFIYFLRTIKLNRKTKIKSIKVKRTTKTAVWIQKVQKLINNVS